MKQYLEKVLAEIPQFISHFAGCLFTPKAFLQQQLSVQQHSKVSQGVEFLFLAFLIALFLSQVLPEATNPLTLPQDEQALLALGSQVLLNLFLILFVAAIAYGVLRWQGCQHSFADFFQLFAFFCGVSMVLAVFANALTNIALIDPVIARTWLDLEQGRDEFQALMQLLLCQTDAVTGELQGEFPPEQQARLEQLQLQSQQLLERPLFVLASSLQGLVSLLVLIWLARVWWLYGRLMQLSGSRIVLSAMLCFGLVLLGSWLLELMQSGAQMMAIYRLCD